MQTTKHLVALAVAAAAACGGKIGDLPPDGGQTAPTGDIASVSIRRPDAGSVRDAEIDVATDAIDATDATDARDASDAALPSCTSTPPASGASVQTVRVIVTNREAEPRWVVTAQWPYGFTFPAPCTPFGIERDADANAPAPVPIAPGWQCGCECAERSGPSYVMKRLAPGESVTLTWDARVVEQRACTWDCSALGWSPTMASLPGTQTWLVPADAGAYDVVLDVETTLPTDCRLDANDATTAECGVGYVPYGTGPSGDAPMCRDTSVVRVPFTLDVRPTVEVDVTL